LPRPDSCHRLIKCVAALLARAYRAVVTSRPLAVAVDARDPIRLARFWAALLGRRVVDDANGAVLPGEDTQLGLQFVPSPSQKVGASRMHVHLTSTSLAAQQHVVAMALELGACHLDVGQLPEEGHVVLADPEGYEFCVIEPGNAFLDGCGLFGELACDGTREVGLFWSGALSWPLVWDQDQETAIQSPHGGTKVAWGGPPVAALVGSSRQRFVLAPVDGNQAAEVDRLVSLGATRLDSGGDGAVAMADPDGNGFCLTVI
jgi:hypothetical protein